MIDSVIKPLVNKIHAVNTNYESIVRALSIGDSDAEGSLRQLIVDVKNLFADFKSAIAHMKYGVTMSPGFVPNVAVMVKMIIYFVKEIIYAIQLFTELLKLAANVANIRTILNWFYDDIAKAQQLLSLAKLHVERALNRTKQKVTKNIEWQKLAILINLDEKYSKEKAIYYETMLTTIKKTQQIDTKKPSNVMTQAEALAYNLQQEKNKQLQINQYAEVQLVESQLKEATLEVDSYENKRKALAEDKRYWKKRWSTEEDQDKKFFSLSPKINANVEA